MQKCYTAKISFFPNFSDSKSHVQHLFSYIDSNSFEPYLTVNLPYSLTYPNHRGNGIDFKIQLALRYRILLNDVGHRYENVLANNVYLVVFSNPKI